MKRKLTTNALLAVSTVVCCAFGTSASYADDASSGVKCKDDEVLVSSAIGPKFCIKPGSGKAFKDCQECPEMTVVPAGSFVMGSPETEHGHNKYEEPQHRVTISKPFAVGKFAVTFEEWDACVADGGCNGYSPEDVRGRGKQPIINVNWGDTQAYAAWLSKKTGKTYRLLSEAEREYVTRAGTATPYWWGSSISIEQANYRRNNADCLQSATCRYTREGCPDFDYFCNESEPVPVDSFKPNPWGLYQVHGNVSDWVEDCFHGDYRDAPKDGTAVTTGECSSRVLRGGSWFDDQSQLRSAYRYWYNPDSRSNSFGFRLARVL